MKLVGFAALTLLLSSCMITQVALDPSWNPRRLPVYEDYFDYYFFGLYGDASVNLQKVCMDQKILGFRTLKSAEDGVFTAITLGVYAPVTVQVWCGN